MAEETTPEADATGKCGHKCQPPGADEAFVEAVVCHESELEENVMTAQNIPDDGEILVVRQNGKIYAIGNTCPHSGAPLHTGSLGTGRVRCPWHGACFNLATGDIEDFPGLDSVPCLKVTVQDDGGVRVRGIRKHLMEEVKIRCIPNVQQASKKDSRTFVIAGGGAAAQVCAETLRENGFLGKIIIIAKEKHFPYDRTLLSKTLNISMDDIILRPKRFYKRYDINLKLGVELLSLSTSEKVLEVSTGEKINYDSLFLATGVRPRQLSCPGSNLQNIFQLRNIEDSNNISKEVEDRNVVIMGASFIGMEMAAGCYGKAKSTTIVAPETLPFERILGSQIGEQIVKRYEKIGIIFFMNSKVDEILPKESDSSCVGQIKLEDGQILDADVVIVGIGTMPDANYLKNTDVERNENGLILVNEFLETNISGVFAGGDIVMAPILGRVANICHWQLAQYHGRIAGRNMLGKKEPVKTVPFFWTILYDKGIRYAGYAPEFDAVVTHGVIEELNFIAFYCKENSVLATATCGNDPVACYFAELLSSGRSLSKTEVQKDPTAWIGEYFGVRRSSRMMGTGNSKEKMKSPKSSDEDTIEGVVCQESDLKENEMKSFELGDGKILVVRQKGNIYAIGNKCSHYGAPLHTGALGDGNVRCPWHGACFNLSTGDIEDFPGLDSLPCFKVNVLDDGSVKVQGSRKQLAAGRRQKSMVCFDKNVNKTFVIVGGGPAAQVCAETLRQDGFKGQLIMLAKEKVLPYDRIKLSKLLDASAEKIALRSADFYKESDIDLKLGVELVNLDATEKVAHLSNGDEIKYDSIFLATGSRARTLSVPGRDLQNIFVLREIEEANNIAKEIKDDKNVVIVGASFIGMECAAFCVGKAKSITVVGRGSVPFAAVLGSEIGGRIMKLFEEKGVQFCMDTDVVEVLPNEVDSSCVGRVKLANEKLLPADIVISGIGAVPNTEYLKNTSVGIEKSGTVPVNEFLETNVPGVFAGGDIALAPVLGRVASIGHWQLAHYHGRIAGRNMLEKKEPLKAIPFFWTMFFGKGIRYSGYAPDFDDIVLHGNLEELKFIAYYCKDNSVLAVATCGNDPIAAEFANLLLSGKCISKEDVKGDPTSWIAKL